MAVTPVPAAGEPTAAGPGVHRARGEVTLLRAALFFRLGGLAQIAGALVTASPHYPRLGPPLALAAVVAAESVIVMRYWWRRRQLSPGVLTADVAFCVAGLWAGSWASPRDADHTWLFFMYPFTLLACVGIGVGYRRLSHATLAVSALAGGYLVTDVGLHGQPWWNDVPNVVSYYANTVVVWIIAGQLRRSGDAADASEAAALSRAAELATARESARYERMLHDRVLQTMEMLGKSEWIADPDIRGYVRSEAAWLRGLVAGAADEGSPDLSTALQGVVREQALRGLQVEVNGSGLRRAGAAGRIPHDVVVAVSGAVREAVTNVGKHAGVDTAVVRAALDHAGTLLTVSVVDQGRGFDPVAVARCPGTGLARSVRERVAQVGGTVRIDSSPGSGTAIELRVPLPARRHSGRADTRG
jgi:signal transduction histidine kinase